jgi:hypothetical protein
MINGWSVVADLIQMDPDELKAALLDAQAAYEVRLAKAG